MPRTTKGRIYNRPSKKYGKVYWLDFTINGNRQRYKLTHDDGSPITRKNEAQAEADRILRPYRAKSEAERRRLAVNAMKDAQQAAEDAEQTAKPKTAVADMWKRHPYDKNTRGTTERKLSATTIRDNRSQWEKFETWCHGAEIRFVEDVTPEVAETYRQHLIDSELSGNRINKLVMTCRVMFNLAGIDPNPFDGLRKRNSKPQRRRELTEEELQTVYQDATGELRTLLAVGLYTGLRLGDAVTVQWEEFARDLSNLIREPSKTSYKADEIVVPTHADLHAVLAETPKADRTGDVMPEFAAIYRDGRSRLAKRIQKHFRNCGIRTHKPGTGYVRNADGSIKRTGGNSNKKVHTGKRAVVEVGFHSLRHSFVSICARQGVPLHVVQALCGHGPQIQKIYLHASTSDISRAIAALPSITKAEDTDTAERRDRERFRALADNLTTEEIRKTLKRVSTLDNPRN